MNKWTVFFKEITQFNPTECLTKVPFANGKSLYNIGSISITVANYEIVKYSCDGDF